jgi:GNAT superfamily N-acetyltransferase
MLEVQDSLDIRTGFGPALHAQPLLSRHRSLSFTVRMSSYSIRHAREQDCTEIARLAGQLGYPVSDDMMSLRLRRLINSSSDIVFVAEASDGGELIGWIQGSLSQYLESDYRVEIAGLVVDERFHRNGIGRDLVDRVERWAVERGVLQASVRCRTTRPEAHLFYESLGYTRAKTQIAFRKPLSDAKQRTRDDPIVKRQS